MDSDAIKTASAERFGQNAEKYFLSKAHAHAGSLQALVALTQPKPTDRLLDVATGAGHAVLAFAPHVREAVAFDLSQGMLDQTLKTAAARGLANVAGSPGDAENLPFPDASFDIVVCRIAAHHFPDQPRFFRESARVLKPGGKLAFVDNYGPGSPDTTRQIEEIERLRDWTHHRTWRLTDLREQLLAAGFEIRLEETGYFDEGGPIDFDDWCQRIGTPADAVAQLREKFLDAGPELKDALRIVLQDGKIGFSLPKVTILAVRS